MLAVAGEVFAERGFHAASMDEIAERADISKPMLYAYFDSKDGLYSAYMTRVGGDLLAAMDAVVAPELEAGEQVLASMTAFLGFVEDHREGWAILQRELAAGSGGRDGRRRRPRPRRHRQAHVGAAGRHARAGAAPTRSPTASSAPASRWRPGGSTTRSAPARRWRPASWRSAGSASEGFSRAVAGSRIAPCQRSAC